MERSRSSSLVMFVLVFLGGKQVLDDLNLSFHITCLYLLTSLTPVRTDGN